MDLGLRVSRAYFNGPRALKGKTVVLQGFIAYFSGLEGLHLLKSMRTAIIVWVSELHDESVAKSVLVCLVTKSALFNLHRKCFILGGKAKAYKCTVCKASYTTRSHLKFHMYKHTGNYPYTCEYCGKGFAGRSQYRYHVLRHSGQSPYICKECGGRFWKKRNLEVHCSKHRCDDAPTGLQKCAVSITFFCLN